jgi:Immunity protein Imm1
VTYSACAPTHYDGVEDGFDIPVSSPADVADLVARLADPATGTAHLESDAGDFVAQAHIEGIYGYLFYVDVTEGAYSLGDPRSPAVHTSEQSFPAGSGITLTELSSTLTNLLNAGRPVKIRWQALDPASRNRAAS